MTIEATKPTEADRLYGIANDKLGRGDLVGASWYFWEAARYAMETYSNARGWEPENRRYYEDIAAFRRREIEDELRDKSFSNGFVSAIMLAENVIERGQLCSEEMVAFYGRSVATLVDELRLDA